MSGPASPEGSAELPQLCLQLIDLAERDPRHAVELARHAYAQAQGQPLLPRGQAAYVLGYTLLRWERFSEAAALLDTAEQQMQSLGQEQLVLHVRRARLYLAQLRGGQADLDHEWEALANTFEYQGDLIAAARSRFGLIAHMNLQGLSDRALEIAARIRPLLERLGTRDDLAWLHRLSGVARLTSGDFDRALAELAEAERIFTELGQGTNLAKTWFEIAHVHERRGNLAQAQRDLDRTYTLVEDLDLPLQVALCEKNLGLLAAQRGEYDRGIYFSLRAIDRLSALNRQDILAGCDLNLGNIAYYGGLADLALAAYRRAEAVYAELRFRQMRLVCRRNQALALRAQGQPEASRRILEELMMEAEQLGERMELAEAIHAYGQVLGDIGDSTRAIAEFVRAEGLFQQLANRAAAGRSRIERGWLLLARGDYAQAADCFAAALSLLSERPIHLWRANYGLGRSAELTGDRSGALNYYRSASIIVARLRQRLANEHASSGLFTQAERLMADALNLAWQLNDAPAVLELAEQQRALALARSVRENRVAAAYAIADLAAIGHLTPDDDDTGKHDPGLAQALQDYRERRLRNRELQPIDDEALIAPLDLTELRAACSQAFPEGWNVLVYVRCADQLLTIVVAPEMISLRAQPYDTQLQRLIVRATQPDYRELTYLEPGDMSGSTTDWPTLSRLGTRLIPPDLPARLNPDQRLLIVAGGILNALPWAALRLSGAWLVELATPQLLPGLQIWMGLLNRRAVGNSALLLGVSNVGSRGPQIPGVAVTLDRVEESWPGVVTRLEEAAASVATLHERALKDELRQYGLIHIAAHGQLVASSGLLTHLKLSDADLYYDDITRLRLAGPLVVLAACEGAAAEILAGEELLSLSHAFLAGGARDVVASLWQLYDRLAPDLLGMLYRELGGGIAAPVALARAQRGWLHHTSNDTELDELARTPLVWAGLSTLGAGVR